MPQLTRRLLQLAFALALVVVGASSALRLAANGIGCAPWPACYGQAVTAADANRSGAAKALRLAHRIAASTFALVALALLATGWRQWRQATRVAAVALLLVTTALAAIGWLTPSTLPAVTLANVLGGFTLLALLALLLVRTRATATVGNGSLKAPAGGILLFALLALQVAGGAMISARLAGDACATGCGAAWLPGAAVLAQPFVTGTATELVHPQRGGQPLHLLHRLAGLALVIASLLAAFVWRSRRRRWATAAMVAAASTGGLGFVIATFTPSLPAAVLHALAAATLVATLAALAAPRVATFEEKQR